MNKTNYLKFMGYRYWKATQGADQTIALAKDDTATNAAALNFGEFALLGTAGTDVKIVITDFDGSGLRGASIGTTTDYYTGATFNDTSGVGTPVAGEATLLPAGGYAIHATSGVITIEASGGTGGDGYDLAAGDIAEVWSYYGVGAGSGHQHDGLVVPATSITGIDPLSATNTRISFKSSLGTQVDDNVVLIHGSGKYKEVCKMIEAACNAHPHGGQLITITDVQNAPSLPLVDQFDLGVIGCTINYAA
tara:strand:- start:40 stop:786 length:747 start_codon:yes stop_codon:yes gene_type:complete